MKKMDFTEEVIKYEAPQVEVIVVEVEKGFAQSEGTGTSGEFGG